VKTALVLILAVIVSFLPRQTSAANEPLIVGYTSIKGCAALFTAKEQGYFEQRGLDVELRVVQNSATEATAIVANAMTLGCSTPPVLLQAVSKGIGLIGIAGGTVSSASDKDAALVARPDAGIAKPEDLIGKKVGVSGIGSTNYVILNAWLMAHHVDPKGISYFEVPFSTMYDVLKRGTVDAVASVVPVLTRILDDKIGAPLVYLQSTPPPGTPIDIYVSSTDWANKNPATVNAFRGAIADGAKFALAHRDLADQYVAKYLNQPLSVVKETPDSILDSRLTAKGMGWWLDAMKAQGLIRNDISDPVVAR
jgi:NitT/TauT family transport system substrate-binding protein